MVNGVKRCTEIEGNDDSGGLATIRRGMCPLPAPAWNHHWSIRPSPCPAVFIPALMGYAVSVRFGTSVRQPTLSFSCYTVTLDRRVQNDKPLDATSHARAQAQRGGLHGPDHHSLNTLPHYLLKHVRKQATNDTGS